MTAQPKVRPEANGRTVVSETHPSNLLADATAGSVGGFPYWEVVLLADMLDDLQKVRIANSNRVGALTRPGDEWGKNVPEELIPWMTAHVDSIEKLENSLARQLERAVLASPLGGLVERTPGLGGPSLGRFIKETGDPAWNEKEGRPRRLRELYAYCGLHVWPTQKPDEGHAAPGGLGVQFVNGATPIERPGSQRSVGVAPFRQRGQKANWSTMAKTRLYVIATTMKMSKESHYRTVYEQARFKYADAVHTVECRQCGPGFKRENPEASKGPAPVGSPLAKGHQDARAMRLVMKAILRDIWEEASRA